MSRITVVTASHIALCPRLLKATRAFAAAGHDVCVVSMRYLPWADALDDAAVKQAPWRWVGTPHGRLARVRHLLARKVAVRVGATRIPWSIAVRAFDRFHDELARAAAAAPADLVYVGGSTAFAAAANAARRLRAAYAVDLEDFHSGEHPDDQEGRLADQLAARIEHRLLPAAAFITASSAGIARTYRERFGVDPILIHNVQPLAPRYPSPPPNATLRLCWFSQSIGPGRGLEAAVAAGERSGVGLELHLCGQALPGWIAELQRRAPHMRIEMHAPRPPDELVAWCARFDVGLALEPGHPRNNALALSNKALTYLAAGLALVATRTPGQQPIIDELQGDVGTAEPGDVEGLTRALQYLAANPLALARARAASYAAAQRRWHWEHPLERGALLSALDRALPP